MPNFTFQIKDGSKIDIEATSKAKALASVKAKGLDATLVHDGASNTSK
jgi:hypothetical protein